jgi:hypothetical protein
MTGANPPAVVGNTVFTVPFIRNLVEVWVAVVTLSPTIAVVTAARVATV